MLRNALKLRVLVIVALLFLLAKKRHLAFVAMLLLQLLVPSSGPPANCFRVLQLNCLEQHNSPSFAGKVPKKQFRSNNFYVR